MCRSVPAVPTTAPSRWCIVWLSWPMCPAAYHGRGLARSDMSTSARSGAPPCTIRAASPRLGVLLARIRFGCREVPATPTAKPPVAFLSGLMAPCSRLSAQFDVSDAVSGRRRGRRPGGQLHQPARAAIRFARLDRIDLHRADLTGANPTGRACRRRPAPHPPDMRGAHDLRPSEIARLPLRECARRQLCQGAARRRPDVGPRHPRCALRGSPAREGVILANAQMTGVDFSPPTCSARSVRRRSPARRELRAGNLPGSRSGRRSLQMADFTGAPARRQLALANWKARAAGRRWMAPACKGVESFLVRGGHARSQAASAIMSQALVWRTLPPQRQRPLRGHDQPGCGPAE